MGENLYNMLSRLADTSDEQIRKIHPQHNKATLKSLLPRFHYFQQGNCVVHHMFGGEVVDRVRRDYGDAYHTAHLEVPGEMFALAMEAQEVGKGVVGSTSNILNFIVAKSQEAAVGGVSGRHRRLRFVLGTEAGMVTAIVRGVEKVLKDAPHGGDVEVEIIFPVASEAVSATDEKGGDLRVVPGVRGGEGCSTAGGCATCPFMKMNSLEALVDVLERSRVGGFTESLRAFLPPKREVELKSKKSIMEVGSLPIVHMRALMGKGKLSDDLAHDVETRNLKTAAAASS